MMYALRILLLNFDLFLNDYLFWLLEDRGEFLYDCFNGVEFLHHLLVVSMALSWVASLNEFTHHDINSQFFLLTKRKIQKISFFGEEIDISSILSIIPIVLILVVSFSLFCLLFLLLWLDNRSNIHFLLFACCLYSWALLNLFNIIVFNINKCVHWFRMLFFWVYYYICRSFYSV